MPIRFSSETQDIIRKLLVVDPRNRLGTGKNGYDDIKKHRFFSNINFNDIEKQKFNAPYVYILYNNRFHLLYI